MISKEKIIEIIREETWVEVDSSRVYGIEEAAEKVLQAIEAAEHSVQADVLVTCANCGVYHSIYIPCPSGSAEAPTANANR